VLGLHVCTLVLAGASPRPSPCALPPPDTLLVAQNSEASAVLLRLGGTGSTVLVCHCWASSVRGGDVDGDGRFDVAMTILGLAAEEVLWYSAVGASWERWSRRTIAESVPSPIALELSDLNGDGTLDVLCLVEPNSMGKVFFYANGGGALPVWTAFTLVSLSFRPVSFSVVDFDASGGPDVLVLGQVTAAAAPVVLFCAFPPPPTPSPSCDTRHEVQSRAGRRPPAMSLPASRVGCDLCVRVAPGPLPEWHRDRRPQRSVPAGLLLVLWNCAVRRLPRGYLCRPTGAARVPAVPRRHLWGPRWRRARRVQRAVRPRARVPATVHCRGGVPSGTVQPGGRRRVHPVPRRAVRCRCRRPHQHLHGHMRPGTVRCGGRNRPQLRRTLRPGAVQCWRRSGVHPLPEWALRRGARPDATRLLGAVPRGEVRQRSRPGVGRLQRRLRPWAHVPTGGHKRQVWAVRCGVLVAVGRLLALPRGQVLLCSHQHDLRGLHPHGGVQVPGRGGVHERCVLFAAPPRVLLVAVASHQLPHVGAYAPPPPFLRHVQQRLPLPRIVCVPPLPGMFHIALFFLTPTSRCPR
jgi:hypothetical protein